MKIIGTDERFCFSCSDREAFLGEKFLVSICYIIETHDEVSCGAFTFTLTWLNFFTLIKKIRGKKERLDTLFYIKGFG
jgi:hypothetical protein